MLVLSQSSPIDPWQAVLSGGGFVSLAMLFLWGFKQGWWVQGDVLDRRDREYEELVKRHEAYRDRVEERILPLLHDTVNATRELVALRALTELTAADEDHGPHHGLTDADEDHGPHHG